MNERYENRYEAEVDTTLAALYEKLDRAGLQLERSRMDLHRAAGDKQVTSNELVNGRPRRVTRWIEKTSTVLKRPVFSDYGDGAPPTEWQQRAWGDAVVVYTVAREAFKVAHDATTAQEDLYTGWSRFYLVLNVDGHIHSHKNCSTCTRTTRFGWLTNVSGLTEKQAVAVHGERLCSVCFPSAPVEWCEGYKSVTKSEADRRRAERDAKREAKEAKKAAYWADKHFEIRFHREDGGSFLYGSDYDHRQFKGRSLKSAVKEIRENNGYSERGWYDAIDLKTGEVAVERDGTIVWKEAASG